MRPATLADLGARYGVAVPAIEAGGTFAAFSALYRAACTVLQTPEDLERLVLEVVEDAAAAGAVWVEPALYPGRYGERVDGLAGEEAVLEIALAAAREAERRTGVGVGLMLSANRTRSPEEALRLAQLAARYAGRGVVAFGLADDEARFGPEPFVEAFAVARTAGLICAPHAGELAGPGSVLGALDRLGARRIQHGVRSVEDPRLVERLAHDGVCLDVCPTSNLVLGVVPSLAAHPLGRLLEAGVLVSINSDDPLFFGSGLAEEYEVCRSVLGLDDAALARIAASSVVASGAPEETKTVALAGIDRWRAGQERWQDERDEDLGERTGADRAGKEGAA